MRSTAPRVTCKSFSSWRVVSVGVAAWLLLAMARGAPSGTGVSPGDDSALADPRSESCPALLALSYRWYVSIIMVSMRSDSMFQCSLEGGLRGIAILDPCHML